MKKFTKKFLVTFLTTLFLTNSASALDFFVGADILHSNALHNVKSSSTISGSSKGTSKNSHGTGYGANVGIRQDLPFLMFSGELFYDQLNLAAKPFSSTNNSPDKLEIDGRYGAKLNAGMTVFPQVKSFLTFGMANIDYTTKNQALNSKKSESKMEPLYGVGVLVDVPLIGISVKAAYDYQQLNSHSPASNTQVRTHLGVARIGVIYNF